MFKVFFGDTLIATFENENESIGLSLNLHNVSNIPHNIFVTKEEEVIITFIQR